jgi:pimeloyl-ACP methyl ester carboxylesterase
VGAGPVPVVPRVPARPGFGQSPLPADYDRSTKQIAGDIVRLMDALKVDRFHLVGAKIGGSTAMQLAADYPDRVRTLAVFGSPAKGSPGGEADLQLRRLDPPRRRARLGGGDDALPRRQ